MAAEKDQIVSLPGMPPYTPRLFSGYLQVPNGGEGFYFLAESQSQTPEKDPVLLWLNGGPGASSLAGWFSENGPLLVNDDGNTLRVNEFSWNKNVNLLCIESPIGVDFSYNASGIYKSDDVAQADDLYWMLQAFYGKFPWLRENDFIIAGESYSGMCVPMTAKRIVEDNKRGDGEVINLKKFVVGNGENEFMALSMITFAYYHGIITTDDNTSISTVCPELRTLGSRLQDNAPEECVDAIANTTSRIQETNINNYNVYAQCMGSPDGGLQEMIHELRGPMQAEPHPIRLRGTVCLDWSKLLAFFNLPTVRTALHAKTELLYWNNIALTSANFDIPALLTGVDVDVDAILKNKVLLYDASQGMVVTPLWRFLIESGIRGVIYHGDADMACDFIGGLWAVESLHLPREQRRSVWSVPGTDQIAGFF